jgi:hypothetical protein
MRRERTLPIVGRGDRGLVLSPPPKDLVGYDFDKPTDSDIRKQLPKAHDNDDQKGKEDDFNEHGKSFL